MKVYKNAWFVRFARKENISAEMLLDAVVRAGNGQIDADLGGGVIKQRIARVGGGKSSGYRSIVLFRTGLTAYFVYGFAKSELENIRKDDVAQFKKMAKHMFALTQEQLGLLIENGQIEEVTENGKEISQ